MSSGYPRNAQCRARKKFFRQLFSVWKDFFHSFPAPEARAKMHPHIYSPQNEGNANLQPGTSGNFTGGHPEILLDTALAIKPYRNTHSRNTLRLGNCDNGFRNYFKRLHCQGQTPNSGIITRPAPGFGRGAAQQTICLKHKWYEHLRLFYISFVFPSKITYILFFLHLARKD